MIEARHDIHIKRGESYRQDFLFKHPAAGQQPETPADLSGITVKSQVRPSKDSPVLTQEITCEKFDAEGRIQLSISADDMANIKSGFYEWDLRLTDDQNGEIAYYIWGQFLVTGRVTR